MPPKSASACTRAIIYTLRLLVLLATSVATLAQTAPPLGYYDAAIGKTGTELKSALHNIIKNHTVLPYTSTTTDIWDALKVLDEDPLNPANVTLIYSGLSALKSDQSTGTSGTWNREHLWPQSFGLIALDANSRAKTDVFSLRAVNSSVNSSRGNKFYDFSVAPITPSAGAPGSTYDIDSWEPRDADKGQIARSLFYMAVRYDGTDPDVPDLELSDTPDPATYHFGKLSTILNWARNSPVANSERVRNQRIYADFQHNRNPFIDHPEFADLTFAGATQFAAWKSVHFTPAELSNPAVSGDMASGSGDGVPNLVKYAMHADPKVAVGSSPVAGTRQIIQGTSYVYLSFPHNRFATDASVTYESSTTLETWSPVAAEPVSIVTTDFETDHVTVRMPSQGTHFFVRVRITH